MLRFALAAAAAACVPGVLSHRMSTPGDGLVTEEADTLYEKWCALEEHTFGCSAGKVIEVQVAQYNRQRSAECDPLRPLEEKECSRTATESMAKLCDNQQECEVPYSHHSTCPEHPFAGIRVGFKCVVPAGPRLYTSFTIQVKTSIDVVEGNGDKVFAQLVGEGGHSGWHELQGLLDAGSGLHPYTFTSKKPIAPTQVCLMKTSGRLYHYAWKPDSVEVFEDAPMSEKIGQASGWGHLSDATRYCRPME